MPRVESIIAAISEIVRVEEMKHHPHNPGCDGKGMIETLLVDRDPSSGPLMPGVYGVVTRCSSCGRVQKIGTLSNADIPNT
jgi:hypothetical protein